ncbi:MFS transporter [Actinocorallia longicatena]|uniref:MFS transporter n=1 Tax=Actinocorallia longicatena TaxID=111803 RepID=UPI0031D4BA73
MRTSGLVRDPATWLVYLQMSTFATMLYGLSAALPLLRIEQDTSQAVAGLHGTALAIGGVACGLSLPSLARRYGRRRVTWTGLAVMDLAVLTIIAWPVLPVTLAGFTVASYAGSLALYSGMAALTDHHSESAGRSAISEANAVAVAVGIGATFLLSVLAGTSASWRAAMLVTPLMTVVVAAALGRHWVKDVPMPERPSGARVPFGPRFQLAGAVLFCAAAVEFCFNLWGAKLFADQAGLSPATAATGLTAFTAGVAAGRVAGARLSLRYPPAPLLVGAMALTGAGWLLFWLATTPLLGYLGLIVSGLGVSVHFPMCVALLHATSGNRPDEAGARASLYAGLGVGIGPFALGALADASGSHRAFLVVPLLIVLAIGGILLQRRLPSPDA